MPPHYEIHPPHEAPGRPPYGLIKDCVSFYCSDCGEEILGWIPSFTANPEKLGWCDACWAKRQGGQEGTQRRAA